jgi:hypothetical protein
MIKVCLTVWLVLISAISTFCQPLDLKNLNTEWQTYETGEYKPYDESSTVNAIYIHLKPSGYLGRDLQIRSCFNYFVFVNGKIAGEHNGDVVYDVDSLAKLTKSSELLISIFQENLSPQTLSTTLTASSNGVIENAVKPTTFFKDFVILAGLIITILFALATRLNPKLSSDYLSLQKVFSLRDADDSQSNARLTNSSNVQFYIMTSMLLALFFIIIFKFLPANYTLSTSFASESFWKTIVLWLLTTLVILLIFLIKISIIFSLTRLFGLRGLARIHYFNWVRLLLIVFGAASIIIFIYFISRGFSPTFFEVLLYVVSGALVAWTLIVFLKLNNKSEHSMFHLFSYICATEIIPLLITIKVLFQ